MGKIEVLKRYAMLNGMSQYSLYLLIALNVSILPGCSQETIYRNVYEGLRTPEELKPHAIESRQESRVKNYD
jgi:hypothetical protein